MFESLRIFLTKIGTSSAYFCLLESVDDHPRFSGLFHFIHRSNAFCASHNFFALIFNFLQIQILLNFISTHRLTALDSYARRSITDWTCGWFEHI